MSITAIYSVFCDECGTWIAQTDSVKAARSIARAAHWKRKRRDGRTVDLCAVCAGVPCAFGQFHDCLVHNSYAERKDDVCEAVLLSCTS